MSSNVTFGDLVALALAKGYEVQEVDQEGEVCMAVFDGLPEVYDKAALLKVVPYLDEIVPVEEYEAAPWQGATEEAIEEVAPEVVEPAVETELAERFSLARAEDIPSTVEARVLAMFPGIRGRVFDGAGGKLVQLRLYHAIFGVEFDTLRVLVENVPATVGKYHAAGWAVELA